MVYEDTARILSVSWVLLEGFPNKEAALRLACHRSIVNVWVRCYTESGEWGPDPVLRSRHADTVSFDAHFLRAVNAVVLSDPEETLGEMKDVFPCFIYPSRIPRQVKDVNRHPRPRPTRHRFLLS